MLMKYNGTTVAVLGGSVRVQLPSGEQQIVPWQHLETIKDLQDRGATEGERYVKLVLTGDQTFGVESNGIWPEDLPRFLRQCLQSIEGERSDG